MENLPDYVQAYRKHKHLKKAALELGMKWQNLYLKLCAYGEPVSGDKERYGSESDKFAAKSEGLFKSLVPTAVDMNRKKFQSKYDFEISGLKVDVKCSKKRLSNVSSKQKRWAFSVKKQRLIADLVVCFGYDDSGDEVETCLAIPGDICRNHGTISLSCRGGKWADYSIKIDELNDFIVALAKAKAA
jgi:hypothetical protein